MNSTISNLRRKPGRPPGSSKLNTEDYRLCRLAADRLLANGTLSTRAALLQVLPLMPEFKRKNALRRLQEKFNRDAELVAARRRASIAATAKEEEERHTANAFRAMLNFPVGGVGYKAVVNTMASSPFGRSVMKMMQDGTMHKWIADSGSLLPAYSFMQSLKRIQESGMLGPKPVSNEAFKDDSRFTDGSTIGVYSKQIIPGIPLPGWLYGQARSRVPRLRHSAPILDARESYRNCSPRLGGRV